MGTRPGGVPLGEPGIQATNAGDACCIEADCFATESGLRQAAAWLIMCAGGGWIVDNSSLRSIWSRLACEVGGWPRYGVNADFRFWGKSGVLGICGRISAPAAPCQPEYRWTWCSG